MDPTAREPAAAAGEREPGNARAALALTLAAYVLFRWTLAVLHLPRETPLWVLGIAAVLSAAGAIGLPVAGMVSLVRVNRSPRVALGLAVAGAAVWLLLWGAVRGGAPPVQKIAGTFQDLAMIAAAAGVGVALAGIIREPNILLPAALFAAFADFVVVNFGTVKHAMSTPQGKALVHAVAAKIPAVHPMLAELAIGPADFIFMGIFLACAARFGMNVPATAASLVAILAGTLLLMQAGVLGSVPALIPMAAAFLLPNWRRFRLTREEAIGSVLVLVLLGGLFLAYFLFLFPGKR